MISPWWPQWPWWSPWSLWVWRWSWGSPPRLSPSPEWEVPTIFHLTATMISPCDQSNDYDDHHDITIVILMINMIVIMASTTMIYSLPTVKITLMTMTFVAHTSWHSFLLKHKTPVLGWWMEGSSSSASSFVKPNVAQEGSEFISVSIIFNCLLLLQRSRREN